VTVTSDDAIVIRALRECISARVRMARGLTGDDAFKCRMEAERAEDVIKEISRRNPAAAKDPA
jgi:hypothetical protein